MIQIYCNPGNGWTRCQAEKYGCSEKLIEDTFAASGYAESGDCESQYQGVCKFIRDMESMGYSAKKYCSKCQAKIDEYNKTEI